MKKIARNIVVPCLLLACMAASAAPSALKEHMRPMITDGDMWRTPNPAYEDGTDGPQWFGLTFDLSPDGSHVTGRLTGVHPDGRQAVYWSLLAFYNPVTQRVVTQQIGWDGTLLYGDVPVQTGPVQIVDMISYRANGTMSISRHENRFSDPDTHTSVVFEKGPDNEWQRSQAFEWSRHRLEAQPPRQSAPVNKADRSFDSHVGFLLAGSGKWRAPNPDYDPEGEEEQFYGMNYSWGPHRRHVIGEIVSIFADGRSERDWSFYITHNPVTGTTHMDQTGARGVYFRGEFETLDEISHAQQGLIYMPNGTVKSVRDEVKIIDDNTYEAHVFERGADGSWKKVRQWTWSRME